MGATAFAIGFLAVSAALFWTAYRTGTAAGACEAAAAAAALAAETAAEQIGNALAAVQPGDGGSVAELSERVAALAREINDIDERAEARYRRLTARAKRADLPVDTGGDEPQQTAFDLGSRIPAAANGGGAGRRIIRRK